jgi:dihydroneopterin aldolase
MKIEIHGLELHGFHGVNEEERRDGQSFLFDVTLSVAEPSTDSIGATIDYRAVRDCIRTVSDGQAYQLLETLAAAVADAIVERFAVDGLEVRIRKPGIAWAEWTGVAVSRGAAQPRRSM